MKVMVDVPVLDLHSRQVVKSISSGAHASLYRLDLSREIKDAAGDTAAFGRGVCCQVFRSSRKKDSVTSACSSPDTMPLPAQRYHRLRIQMLVNVARAEPMGFG